MRAESLTIHHGNVARLEAGDRVKFEKSEYHRDDQSDLPSMFEATVASTFANSIHGPRIFTVEKFGDDNENDFYLADDWIITLIPPVKKGSQHGVSV